MDIKHNILSTLHVCIVNVSVAHLLDKENKDWECDLTPTNEALWGEYQNCEKYFIVM